MRDGRHARGIGAREQRLSADPGNPAAGLKLVNDLDLVVTNLDTGQVFFGNDIPAASTFNLAWDTNAAPRPDLVNNVENVYLAPPLGTNYSITVLARRVNVNAVTAHTNDVVQDYALVVSSSNGEIAADANCECARRIDRACRQKTTGVVEGHAVDRQGVGAGNSHVVSESQITGAAQGGSRGKQIDKVAQRRIRRRVSLQRT